MTLVFAGVCGHGGFTGRAHQADPGQLSAMHGAFDEMRRRLEAARPEVLLVVAAEHFAAFSWITCGICDGHGRLLRWADRGSGLARHPPVRVPGLKELSRRLIADTMQDIDLAYAEEWKLDHGFWCRCIS